MIGMAAGALGGMMGGGGMPGIGALDSLSGGGSSASSGGSGMGGVNSNWHQAGINFGTQNNPTSQGGDSITQAVIIGGAVLLGVVILARK